MLFYLHLKMCILGILYKLILRQDLCNLNNSVDIFHDYNLVQIQLSILMELKNEVVHTIHLAPEGILPLRHSAFPRK
jgi:hypothetical protein